MSHEWLLIGALVLFVCGWAAGRLDIRHIRKVSAEIPENFLIGLSHLLTKNEDKALDAFLRAYQTDTASEDFRLGLGELLRRGGDHRQALKIHQQLYKQENLSVAARHRALWELAQDYQYMGIIDLAEKHAKPLLAVEDYADRAFTLLLNIYQQRRQYDKALKLVESLGEDVATLNRKLVAQWYCQFAEAQPDKKSDLLKIALSKNPDCARASLLLAKQVLAEAPPNPSQALHYLTMIEQHSPQYLWLAVKDFIHANDAIGNNAAGRQIVQRWLRDTPSPMLLSEICQILKEQTKPLTEQYLATHHDAAVAMQWTKNDTSPTGLAIHSLLQRQAKKPFICENCGYEVNDFSWQCRGCLAWESLRQTCVLG